MTQLAIKLLFKFTTHPISVSALPKKNQPKQNMRWSEWNYINKFCLSRSLAPWRNRPHACACTMGQHFDQFYCRQL